MTGPYDMGEADENVAFGLLHLKRAQLDEMLNETAEEADDPLECLQQIQAIAAELNEAAQALTVTDFEDEYPEDGIIDGEIMQERASVAR